jgi:hypothetical protein
MKIKVFIFFIITSFLFGFCGGAYIMYSHLNPLVGITEQEREMIREIEAERRYVQRLIYAIEVYLKRERMLEDYITGGD